MAKIRMKKPTEAITLEAAFKEFTIAWAAGGVADKTLQTYASHFNAAAKHLDMGLTLKTMRQKSTPHSPSRLLGYKCCSYSLPTPSDDVL